MNLPAFPKSKPSPITVRFGHSEFLKINADRFDWRDAYHWILSRSWPEFAGLVFGVYLLVNLVFAQLYLLDEHSVAELHPGSYLYAFFFSVETLATVGYGHMYPDSIYGHTIATLEIMVGMFGLAVITGLIFVRFSRPIARIMFSKVAVVGVYDGELNLMIRVANLRHHTMAEAQFRLMMIRNEIVKEGEEMRKFYPLKLHYDHVISFPVALILRHRIDETSPLFGWTPEQLKKTDTRLFASVVCLDTVIVAPIQSQTDYIFEEILWARRFIDIYSEGPDGRFTVDYGKIHDTEPSPVLAVNQ
jgi:inward rectifier potassium channel